MIEQWFTEMSGSDIAGLLVALGAVITALFGWLSARQAGKVSLKPLESAERLMKSTEQVNARTATSMDTLTSALITHLVEIKVTGEKSETKIDEIVRRVSARRRK